MSRRWQPQHQVRTGRLTPCLCRNFAVFNKSMRKKNRPDGSGKDSQTTYVPRRDDGLYYYYYYYMLHIPLNKLPRSAYLAFLPDSGSLFHPQTSFLSYTRGGHSGTGTHFYREYVKLPTSVTSHQEGFGGLVAVVVSVSTSTMHFAFCTHNATRFVFKLCAVRFMRGVYSSSSFTKIMVEQLLKVTSEYEGLRRC